MSVSPEVFEPIWRHFGIGNRVHNVLGAHVVLEGPGVMPIVGELIAGRVPEHVRVDWQWKFCGYFSPGDRFEESRRGSGTAALESPYSRDVVLGVLGAPCTGSPTVRKE